MAADNKIDVIEFCYSVSLASIYSLYVNICNYYKLPEHESIVKWVLEAIEKEQTYFNWSEDFFSNDYFSPIYEIIKKGKCIQYFSFDNTILDLDRASIILQIMGNFPPYQLFGLHFQK